MKIIEIVSRLIESFSNRDVFDQVRYNKFITRQVEQLEQGLTEHFEINELCDRYDSIKKYLLNYSIANDNELLSRLSAIRADLIARGGASYLSY
jgi:hypothetical protein